MHYHALVRVGRYYNSWHQCKYDHSDEEPQCQKLRQWTYSMCPVTWVRSANPLPSAGSPPSRSTHARTLLAILVPATSLPVPVLARRTVCLPPRLSFPPHHPPPTAPD